MFSVAGFRFSEMPICLSLLNCFIFKPSVSVIEKLSTGDWSEKRGDREREREGVGRESVV